MTTIFIATSVFFPENFFQAIYVLSSCPTQCPPWKKARHSFVFMISVVVKTTSIIIVKLNMCLLKLAEVTPPPPASGTLTPSASKLQRCQDLSSSIKVGLSGVSRRCFSGSHMARLHQSKCSYQWDKKSTKDYLLKIEVTLIA